MWLECSHAQAVDYMADNCGVCAENMCVHCGGEAEQCCMDSEQVEYCSGSNMRCTDGVIPAPFSHGPWPTPRHNTSCNFVLNVKVYAPWHPALATNRRKVAVLTQPTGQATAQHVRRSGCLATLRLPRTQTLGQHANTVDTRTSHAASQAARMHC